MKMPTTKPVKLVPPNKMFSGEAPLETTSRHQKFKKMLKKVLKTVGDIDLTFDSDRDVDDDVPDNVMIPMDQLEDLRKEVAKLRTQGGMELISLDKLLALLSILEKNIRSVIKVSPFVHSVQEGEDDGEDHRSLMKLAMQKGIRGADACLVTLYILTSPNMQRQVYQEDLIDRVVMFTKTQQINTIFPSFDPAYRESSDEFVSSAKKRRVSLKKSKDKSVHKLYNKLVEVVSLLADLLSVEHLTDSTVLQLSSIGISSFFVEDVSQLQLSSLKLVVNIFRKYEKHQPLLLDDILAKIAQLPSSKRSLRSYQLNSKEQIQMLTALVLQLVQASVVLPLDYEVNKQIDPDLIISNAFLKAKAIASSFLCLFLAKCSSKSEEIDYRPIFENFVQDLFTTLNKPEWPAAEVMLCMLGNLLVVRFTNRNLDMPSRLVALEYFGVMTMKLHVNATQSNLKIQNIDEIIKQAQNKDMQDENGNVKAMLTEEKQTQLLQEMLLDFLAMKSHLEPALTQARYFCLTQWYMDFVKSTNVHNNSSVETKSKKSQEICELKPVRINGNIKKKSKTSRKVLHVVDSSCQPTKGWKSILLSKILSSNDPHMKENRETPESRKCLEDNAAELVSCFLASRRPFYQLFPTYLKQILSVLTETSVLMRTKAMKCLALLVEMDPDILALRDVCVGVNYSFHDQSAAVREAAVDLVGKSVLGQPELIDKYYAVLSDRILDTGVSVRKKVIKIFKNICTECPEYSNNPEICVKIARRVYDEEGVRRLVLEVFQNLWFTPVQDKPHLDQETLHRKVKIISNVVTTSLKETGLDWFELLLESIFKFNETKEVGAVVGHEQHESLMQACLQIVDCLIEKVLKVDTKEDVSAQHLVASLKTLHLFAKIKPQLLVKHVHKLQPYLNLKCETHEEQQMISCVAHTLEVVVPLMEHPDESFLASLEEGLVKLLSQQEPVVIASCVSCLGSIINNTTHNYKLIRDCFITYFGVLWNYTKVMNGEFGSFLSVIKRSLYIVGILLRFFNLVDMRVVVGSENNILASIVDTFLFYVKHDSLKAFALKAIGSVCIRHFQLMLGPQLNQLYNEILSDPKSDWELKVQVLSNIEQYLVNEERQMMKQDQEWLKSSKEENLKEMGDISSGMASSVIQCYLKELLQAFIHSNVAVRRGSSRVIQLVLAQGLVHPVQIVPYLICMSTDEESSIYICAEQQLQLIERKYPGFVLMKALNGILLSYDLQIILQDKHGAVRGYRLKEELPTAFAGFLYSILQTKQQRRAILLSILKQFDEITKTSLSQLLYLADNIAHFTYHTLEEPLFIIHHINIKISVTGTNLLKMISETLLAKAKPTEPQSSTTTDNTPETDEDEDEDIDSLLSRVPEDTSSLQESIMACQGCVLLLNLKQHLKSLYNLNDSKITQYSPSESTKVYDKAVNRKHKTRFNPKATLLKVKRETPPLPQDLGVKAKKDLLSEYLEFKKLVMNLDPNESEGEESMQVLPVSKKAARDKDSGQALSLEPAQAHLPCEQQAPTAAETSNLKQLAEAPTPLPQACKSNKKNQKRKRSK